MLACTCAHDAVKWHDYGHHTINDSRFDILAASTMFMGIFFCLCIGVSVILRWNTDKLFEIKTKSAAVTSNSDIYTNISNEKELKKLKHDLRRTIKIWKILSEILLFCEVCVLSKFVHDTYNQLIPTKGEINIVCINTHKTFTILIDDFYFVNN